MTAEPEYLDSHGGTPGLPPGPPPPPRARRTGLLVGGLLSALVLLGGGAWAAWSFFATGPQPAEALPDTTLAYASVDLDPSGGQKIEALRTLKKFPAFEENVGIDTDDDIREWIVDRIVAESDCDLDYATDVEPWLGDRMAVAAVDHGDTPTPIFVLQVSDAAKAEDGLAAFAACAGASEGDAAWAVNDGWALVGESQDVVDDIAEEAQQSPLSADDDFQHWTSEAGDSGIVSMYAAPAAGDLLADELGDDLDDELGDELGSTAATLEDFGGAAATIRFADGGLELEVAADAGATGSVAGGDSAGDVVASLPEGTVAAMGMSFGDGWVDQLLDQISAASGESREELMSEASSELGLELPEDLETLAGDAVAVAVDGDFDPSPLFESSAEADGSEVLSGVGVKIQGDPDGIEAVLDKLRETAGGEDEGLLDSEVGGDGVAMGPDADYRERLVSDRGLGDSEVFRDVVEHREDAAAVLFVDFDAGDDWLVELADDDAEARENLDPLRALGLSAWLDGDTSHVVLKVTTD